MKLTDLAAKWCAPNAWCGPDFYIGVSFECPSCPAAGRRAHRLVVRFHPPIDTGNLAAQYGEDWLRPFMVGHQRASGVATADTLDALTLTPSVNFEGHWHGHITNGVVSNVSE